MSGGSSYTLHQTATGDYPPEGTKVLVWEDSVFGSEWQIAKFNGLGTKLPRFAWDCDTYGLSAREVEFWCELPHKPEGAR